MGLRFKLIMNTDSHFARQNLTERQYQVWELVSLGYTDRRMIGRTLYPQVGVQAVHQIILRIRKRLIQRSKDGRTN